MTNENTKAALHAQRIENTVSSLTRLIKNGGLTTEMELSASSELYTRSVELREAKQIAHYNNREFGSYKQLRDNCDCGHVQAMEIVAAHNEDINSTEPCNVFWSK